MKFKQLYSSSSGNLYIITSGKDRLLIECGVTFPKLLKALDYDLSNIAGCLISHEHLDHCKAVNDVIKAGIDIYTRPGTIKALDILSSRRAFQLTEQWQQIGCFRVLSFETSHDAADPIGFIISDGKDTMLFATDTSHLIYQFRTAFDIVAIECSYNREYLQKRINDGTINQAVAKRLLLSHMEENETLRTLKDFINLKNCREIHLLHCSADNMNKERIKKKFEKELLIEVKTI